MTHFVAGLGTTGTFVGTSRRLKELNPRILCYDVQPDSPMHGLEGLKHLPTALVPGIYDASIADERLVITISSPDSLRSLGDPSGKGGCQTSAVPPV